MRRGLNWQFHFSGNEISRVEGLNGLYNLTELVLDRNKIKQLNECSFVDLTQLRELHLEENRLGTDKIWRDRFKMRDGWMDGHTDGWMSG